MNRINYVSVGGHRAINMDMYIAREGQKGAREYDASTRRFLHVTNPRYFYSPAHAIVRARRIALLLVFFVEKTADPRTPHEIALDEFQREAQETLASVRP
jgi:hypothetical protein